jgi:hypothetical protein
MDPRAKLNAGFRWAAGKVGLLPVQRVIDGLESRGVDLGRMRALEVFGYTGERMTRYYAPLVQSLDIWEIDERFEPTLRSNFPEADVKITDSYEEIRRTERTYDLVVVDNFAYSNEHFQLFPHVFRVLSDDAVLVVLTLPHADERTQRLYPSLFDEPHLRERRAFYSTDSPDRIPLDDIASHYAGLAAEEGLSAQWHFFVRRRELDGLWPKPTSFYLLVLKLERP